VDQHQDNSDESPEDRKKRPKGAGKQVSVVRADDGAWELREPRCARVRREDLEEVQQMIDAGETEIAKDELRWLLSECRDFIAAHKLLGDLAVDAGDWKLARGHYGYAHQLGVQAIDRAGAVKPVLYAKPANKAFFEASRGLVQSLMQLGKRGTARDVVQRVLELDARDPLTLRGMLEATACGGDEAPKRRRKKRSRRSPRGRNGN
jgi:Tfp pilus assembly protein PilF